MNRAALWLIVAVLALSAILMFRYGADSQGPDFTAHPAVGKSLPEFHVVPITGAATSAEPTDLKDLSGKVVLVNIWGTWCGPCVQEIPHIASLQRQLASRTDATVFPISYGRDGLAVTDEELSTLQEDTAAFLTQMGLQMTTYADPGGKTYGALQSMLGSVGFPTNVVIDRQGIIRGVWTGYGPGMERQVERLMRELLKED